jgi:hypothetical protein
MCVTFLGQLLLSLLRSALITRILLLEIPTPMIHLHSITFTLIHSFISSFITQILVCQLNIQQSFKVSSHRVIRFLDYLPWFKAYRSISPEFKELPFYLNLLKSAYQIFKLHFTLYSFHLTNKFSPI